LVLLLLWSSWGCGLWSPVCDIACGLATSTRYDVARGPTQGLVLGYCCGCICHFLTAHNLCGVSIPSLLALLICLASLRGHVDEDH
jgi:hypothetical protein